MSEKQIGVALLLVVSVLMSIGCNPNNALDSEENSRSLEPRDSSGKQAVSDFSPPTDTSEDSSAASREKNGSGHLSHSEPPVTTIEYCDMKARKADLAAHQHLQYGARTKTKPLSESDPRYQTVAGAIDAVVQHGDLERAQNYFPRNICVGVIDLAGDMSYRAGSFEELLSCHLVDVCVQPDGEQPSPGEAPATVQYVEARCRWDRAVMLCRISLADEADEDEPPCEDFWLARDSEGPTFKGFAANGYFKGSNARKLALAQRAENKRKETLKTKNARLPAMRIELASEDGAMEEAPLGLTLWKLSPPLDIAKYPKTGASFSGRSSGYFWDTDDTFWKSHTSFGRGAGPVVKIGMNIDTPTPGTYRLSTRDRMAMGSPFRLDHTKPISKATLLLNVSWRRVPCEIEAVLVDPETGEHIDGVDDLGFSYKIYRDNDIPVSTKRIDFHGMDRVSFEGSSRTRYEVDLRPGNYRVDIFSGCGQLSENAFGQVTYFRTAPIQTSIRVEPGPPVSSPAATGEKQERRRIPMALPMQLLNPTSEAAKKLLPLSVQGTVTYQDGAPASSTRVLAIQAGQELARTTTDENGQFHFRFAVPELIDMDPRFLPCNSFRDVLEKLKGEGISSEQALLIAGEQAGKAHVAIQVEQPGSVLQEESLLVATISMPDKELMTPNTGASLQPLNKHFITPDHPVEQCNLTLTTIAELEAEFVDADGKKLTGGNVFMTDPRIQTRRLNATRDEDSLHHCEKIATSSHWQVSTIAIGGTIDYLERPIIQLPEPGLWKVTFQVVPSPINAAGSEQLWEETKAERIGNRGTRGRPVQKSELVTLRIVNVTRPDGSIVEPAFINRPSP